ncbi:Adenylyl cyclase-associated protein CAP, fungal type [Phytophthora cactorum]|nr:Adenylyl cyclase-associated protein CAP, fungal type [Phytophthora cactorum]
MQVFLHVFVGRIRRTNSSDEYVEGYLHPFFTACEKLGDSTLQLGELLKKAFTAQRTYLLMTSQCKRPQAIRPTDFKSLSELQSCMRPARSATTVVNSQPIKPWCTKRCKHWASCVLSKHPKPAVDSFVEGQQDPRAYIKSYHLVGVTWNPKGGDVSNYTPGAASSAKVAAPAGGGMANVFTSIKSIGQSGGKTAGLNKVTKEHADLAQGLQGRGYGTDACCSRCRQEAGRTRQDRQASSLRRAQRELADRVPDRPEPLTVSGINMKQQVYIFGCEGATILLEGKAKNIVLDSCKKTKLVFDNSVSSIEIVNCKGVQVQCKGVVPSVAIDKTDGCLVYISWRVVKCSSSRPRVLR